MRRIRAVIVRLMFVVSGHVTKTAVLGGGERDRQDSSNARRKTQWAGRGSGCGHGRPNGGQIRSHVAQRAVVARPPLHQRLVVVAAVGVDHVLAVGGGCGERIEAIRGFLHRKLVVPFFRRGCGPGRVGEAQLGKSEEQIVVLHNVFERPVPVAKPPEAVRADSLGALADPLQAVLLRGLPLRHQNGARGNCGLDGGPHTRVVPVEQHEILVGDAGEARTDVPRRAAELGREEPRVDEGMVMTELAFAADCGADDGDLGRDATVRVLDCKLKIDEAQRHFLRVVGPKVLREGGDALVPRSMALGALAAGAARVVVMDSLAARILDFRNGSRTALVGSVSASTVRGFPSSVLARRRSMTASACEGSASRRAAHPRLSCVSPAAGGHSNLLTYATRKSATAIPSSFSHFWRAVRLVVGGIGAIRTSTGAVVKASSR